MTVIFEHFKNHPYYGLCGLITLLLLLVSYVAFYGYETSEPIKTNTATQGKPLNTKNFATVSLKNKELTHSTAVTSIDSKSSQSTTKSANIRPLLTTLPDFNSYHPVANKKRAFFDFLRPLAQTINEEVLQLRQELQNMDPNNLSPSQKRRIARLARTYKVLHKTDAERLESLLKKIYPIPTALTLAQAASESGWGTSRFAVEGNNLFGQWCFTKGCGIVPNQRDNDGNHEVKVFATPKDSVASYVRNLNSHGGYINLRSIRLCLNNQGQAVTARDLTHGLIHYSSRGIEYVNDIKTIIKQNKLEHWDENWWGEDNTHPCSQLIGINKTMLN